MKTWAWWVVSKTFLIFTLRGSDPNWRTYFSNGLKPPTIQALWEKPRQQTGLKLVGELSNAAGDLKTFAWKTMKISFDGQNVSEMLSIVVLS